ncbi:NAD(P)-dependent oxidoreductase [Derxia gummosa]|uniref:NAD(P)-dependent oxidoreductase n=1 Tax=Derxia gummosa DSM 723 TaxID=1121388 RepID=A0A8B6X7V5_9BURK|nr:NAD(P)-dependent oxidoreductase [Derxia gummosa]
MSRVAVLGTGAMGSRFARGWLAAGHEVAVWNRDAARLAPLIEAGAIAHATPAAAAEGADFVVSMLRDDAASREVWLGAGQGALRGLGVDAVALECSTLSPAWTRELAATFAAAGRRLVDAPVSGSVPQAEARQLVWLVGADATDLARVTPLLRDLGPEVLHAGAPGTGMALKLFVNAMLGVQLFAFGELLGMAEAEGLAPATAAAHFARTLVASPIVNRFGGIVAAGQTPGGFTIELLAKDFGYLALPSGAGPSAVTACAMALRAAVMAGAGGRHPALLGLPAALAAR